MRGLWTTCAVMLIAAAISGCSGGADTAVEGQARDPVCGMTTAVAGKPDFVYRETRFHFCSSACLDKFKTSPSTATTGLPGEKCVCSEGQMKSCGCGHCVEKPERCDCGDPSPKAESDGHNHESHDHK